MPIYMDRHDIEGATAKEKVKQLHEEAHGLIPGFCTCRRISYARHLRAKS
jgi:hypothetical protein